MRTSNQITQIRDIIINNPLFPIIRELAFQNNFPPIFKTEVKGIFTNGKTPLEALTNFTQSVHIKKTLEENLFHYLTLFVQTTEEAYITKENFNNFVNEKIIDPTKSTEENNEMLERCKNILTLLGIFSADIKPLQEEFSEYKKTKSENNYDSIFWSKTNAAKFVGVKRQTIYNWIKEEDKKIKEGEEGINFTNESGKVIVSIFREFLKRIKPNEYAIFQKKWDEQAD